MMQRGHAEDTLAEQAETRHLYDHRNRLEHEKPADDGEHQLMLRGHGDRAERAAKRERSRIPHENLRRGRIEPEEAEACTNQRAADHGKLAGALHEVDLQIFGEQSVADEI